MTEESRKATGKELNEALMALAKRRGFIYPSYDIYGGVAGFYDYGPLGAPLKHNIENVWREVFVIGEGFFEIETPVIGPEPVFEASGHLKEFSDLLVECRKCGEAFRADHLITHLVPNADALAPEEVDKVIRDNKVRCPECKGELTETSPFNLMFKTNIGPGSKRAGYLRPETAQAMFTNFTNLYRYNRESLPFGAVQIGRGYRNEISPRQGIIRIRELNMAEAEIFFHPDLKVHPRFEEVSGDKVTLVPSDGSGPKEMTVGDAVKKRMIGNEALGYYLARTARFLEKVGVDPKRTRFRQHEKDEMAHYASDCWDAEALISFGWVEIVGIADRTCFDLSAHIDKSGVDLVAFIKFDEPRTVERDAVIVDFKVLGPLFKGEAKAVEKALQAMDPPSLKGKETVSVNLDGGKKVDVPSKAFKVERRTEKVAGERVTPHVIEPSFGIDRITYCVLEHAYKEMKKEGEDYVLLSLRPKVAPIKVGVFPLIPKDGLGEMTLAIEAKLRSIGIMTYYDDSGTIGRRYARMDEIGTPFCVTVDFDSKKDGKATIRDRDTTEQIRVHIEDLNVVLRALLQGEPFAAVKKMHA